MACTAFVDALVLGADVMRHFEVFAGACVAIDTPASAKVDFQVRKFFVRSQHRLIVGRMALDTHGVTCLNNLCYGHTVAAQAQLCGVGVVARITAGARIFVYALFKLDGNGVEPKF